MSGKEEKRKWVLCSECHFRILESDDALLCEEHNEVFHARCRQDHSEEKHNAYYREVEVRNGKIVRI